MNSFGYDKLSTLVPASAVYCYIRQMRWYKNKRKNSMERLLEAIRFATSFEERSNRGRYHSIARGTR